jgi:outer membrane protein assembly factor BamB
MARGIADPEESTDSGAVASEKVKDENPASEASKASAGKAKARKTAKDQPKPADAKADDAKADKTGKAEKANQDARARKAAADSGTAKAAAHARTVMQHRHLRIGFAMTAAIGVELAGAAGLVAGALLPWEWDEPLLGRIDQPGVVTQVLVGLTLVGLLLAWVLRSPKARVRLRIALLLPAAAVAVLAVALTLLADHGARDAGGLVTAIGAVLVIGGAVGWLVGLRRLRVLFPFGLADARRKGYGNLAAVRRAQFIGGPAGAVVGVAVVGGALLVLPGWLATEDSQTASSLALGAEPPAAGGAPAWELELPATAREERAFGAKSTPHGLVVDELQGVRGVDPRTGDERWHWRDEAYERVATALTDGGATVVLGLRYDGEGGRDRVVGLDSATGELRWSRFDADLVTAMSSVIVTPPEGDWFVVPEQAEQPPDAAARAPVSLLAVGSDDGEVRWRTQETADCQFTAVDADSPGVIVTTEDCTQEDGTSRCIVTGLNAETGEATWTWPAEGAVSGCQTTATPDLVVIRHEAGEPGEDGSPPPPAGVALNPADGTQTWAVEPDENGEVRGLVNPTVFAGMVVGTEFADDGQGGGHAVLVIREASDGSLRSEVDLPAGRAIDVARVNDGLVAIPLYEPTTGTVSLVEFDIAAETVRSESPIITGTAEGTVQWLAISVGPETLTVDTLIAGGANPEAPEFTMRVSGW